MPYKNPEDRRAYQRKYKSRQRLHQKLRKLGGQTPSIPKEANKPERKTVRRKAYVCPKVPSHRFPGMIVFKNGIFVTDQPEEQMMIESDPLYGKEIFSWMLEP
jgi:hypothetical protein